jgi:hypothetical protein
MASRCGRRCSTIRTSCRVLVWSRRWAWRSGPGGAGRARAVGRPARECVRCGRSRGRGEGERSGHRMIAGADSISDMDLLRHGGMGRLFHGVRAPSTLGTFLRAFRFGHVRQLDAVAARFVAGLSRQAPLIAAGEPVCYVDMDDTMRGTFGYAKQGTGYGYSGVKGLNALLATASTPCAVPKRWILLLSWAFAVPVRRSDAAGRGSPRLYPGHPSAAAAAPRTGSRWLGSPVATARADIMPRGRPVHPTPIPTAAINPATPWLTRPDEVFGKDNAGPRSHRATLTWIPSESRPPVAAAR